MVCKIFTQSRGVGLRWASMNFHVALIITTLGSQYIVHWISLKWNGWDSVVYYSFLYCIFTALGLEKNSCILSSTQCSMWWFLYNMNELFSPFCQLFEEASGIRAPGCSLFCSFQTIFKFSMDESCKESLNHC